MKTFFNTTIIVVFLIATLIINTIITYKDYRKNRWFPYGYSDYAILVEAFRHEFIKTEFNAFILIPIALILDILIILFT